MTQMCALVCALAPHDPVFCTYGPLLCARLLGCWVHIGDLYAQDCEDSHSRLLAGNLRELSVLLYIQLI